MTVGNTFSSELTRLNLWLDSLACSLLLVSSVFLSLSPSKSSLTSLLSSCDSLANSVATSLGVVGDCGTTGEKGAEGGENMPLVLGDDAEGEFTFIGQSDNNLTSRAGARGQKV